MAAEGGKYDASGRARAGMVGNDPTEDQVAGADETRRKKPAVTYSAPDALDARMGGEEATGGTGGGSDDSDDSDDSNGSDGSSDVDDSADDAPMFSDEEEDVVAFSPEPGYDGEGMDLAEGVGADRAKAVRREPTIEVARAIQPLLSMMMEGGISRESVVGVEEDGNGSAGTRHLEALCKQHGFDVMGKEEGGNDGPRGGALRSPDDAAWPWWPAIQRSVRKRGDDGDQFDAPVDMSDYFAYGLTPATYERYRTDLRDEYLRLEKLCKTEGLYDVNLSSLPPYMRVTGRNARSTWDQLSPIERRAMELYLIVCASRNIGE